MEPEYLEAAIFGYIGGIGVHYSTYDKFAKANAKQLRSPDKPAESAKPLDSSSEYTIAVIGHMSATSGKTRIGGGIESAATSPGYYFPPSWEVLQYMTWADLQTYLDKPETIEQLTDERITALYLELLKARGKVDKKCSEIPVSFGRGASNLK